MKRILICLSAALLCACTASAQHAGPDPTPETTPSPTKVPETVEIEYAGCDYDREPLVIHFPMRTDTQDVIFELDEQYVTFQIPAECRYELKCDGNQKILTVSKGGQDVISLYHGILGVCGTGLEQKTDTLADHPVRYGYYDGSPEWSFITFDDLKFALTKSGPEGNDDVIELLLDTMRISDYPQS